MVIESDNIVAETAARIFADLADPQTINRASDNRWKEKLWRALSEAGLTLAWVPEKQGGAGASLAEGFAILGVAGRYAVPVPLAETLIAGWLLARAGRGCNAGAMTVAPARPRDRIVLNADGSLSGLSRGIPFAKDCEHIAVGAAGDKGAAIALVKTADCRVSEGQNLAGDGSDSVTFERTKVIRSAPAPAGFDPSALMLMGASVRSVQAAGALRMTLVRSKVTLSDPSPARFWPSLTRQSAVLTKAIATPLSPAATTAMCSQSLAKGIPRLSPLKLPSAFNTMRSRGRAGATVIAPAGAAMPARASSHPAISVSASGTGTA